MLLYFGIEIYRYTTKKNLKYVFGACCQKKNVIFGHFKLFWFFFLKFSSILSCWLRVMFYIIKEMSSHWLKDEIIVFLNVFKFHKFIIIIRKFRPKSSSLLIRTCTFIAYTFLKMFCFLFASFLILKCPYFCK